MQRMISAENEQNAVEFNQEEDPMLKDTVTINHLELRNRIVMPPMATGKAVQGLPI